MKEPMEMILETQSLCKFFGALAATNNVNFSVGRGEIKALIGPNGAGKSTFFNLVTGILSPSSGQIVFKGRDITSFRPDQVSHIGIARSYQITNIFPNLTTFENIRLSVQSRSRRQSMFTPVSRLNDVAERAEVIIGLMGLEGRRDALAANLSHGEQRRVEIGISLATSPELLLLDEPTAGMSPGETEEMVDLVRNIAKDLTVVIVEHDMKVVMELAQSISVLHYGEIIADGTPDEVCNNQQVLEVYLGGELLR